MDSVTQKHSMACGLACVAYVTRMPYDQIAQDQPADKLSKIGFYCPELAVLLNNHGKQYRWKKLAENERDNEFNIGDIVFIERSSSYPAGHFLTKSIHGWMDPWINLDFTKIDLAGAISGYRKTLPGKAEYLLYKVDYEQDPIIK